MRRFALLLLFFAALALWGCANTVGLESPEMQTKNTAEAESVETQTGNVTPVQTEKVDSNKLMKGMYGIRFFPEGVTEGYVELVYMDPFGVCGTGLTEEQVTIAGKTANIGTYDGHEYLQ